MRYSGNDILVYRMKSQQFPVLKVESEGEGNAINVCEFLGHLSKATEAAYLQHNYKAIEESILTLAKQKKAEEAKLQVVQLLCQLFRQTQLTQFLTLLRAALNVETKFEANAQIPADDVLNHPNTISSATPIALPYYPQAHPDTQHHPLYGPQLPQAPLVIAVHPDDSMNDVGAQKKHEDAKKYYSEDSEQAGRYIECKFRVVKREGISVYFTRAAELISSELMESFLEEEYLQLPTPALIELLQLLDYINAPLYTFHLSHIITVITSKTQALLQTRANSKTFTKDHFAAIVNACNSITDRWPEDSSFNRELWNWQISTRMISHFISSDVSQKQLYAVKALGEICRKSRYYNYSISEERISEFIINRSILEEIYRGDNHPEVISKGQEVLFYVINQQGLMQSHVDLLFNLLQKCHQNLSKSLFVTLSSIESKHLELSREQILEKIRQLPRASCFNTEAFALIRKLAMLTPPQAIEPALKQLFSIIQTYYSKLKKQLKTEAITIYFQLFQMGIELEVFDSTQALLPLKAALDKGKSELLQHMISGYIAKLQDRVYDLSQGKRFKAILNEGIKQLIGQQLHKWQKKDQSYLRILRVLLENYDEINNELFSYQELWELIKYDKYFAKFVRFYPENIQTAMIASLIASHHKTPHDLDCILQLYHLMNPVPRQAISQTILEEFFKTNQLIAKYALAPQVLAIQETTFELALEHFANEQKSLAERVSWLILLSEIIKRQDEKGFGQWGPFECWNDGDVLVKVFNTSSDSRVNQLQLTVKSYSTLFQIVRSILKVTNQPFQRTKIKLNDKYVELHQLKQKIASLTPLKKVSLEVYETIQCEWFDKAQLFDKDGIFKISITDALKQLFNNFSTHPNKLYPQNIAEIFKTATSQQIISVHDARVKNIINLHSNNGQYLTLEEWINFYYMSAQKNAPLVISNLMNLGYRHLFNQQPTFDQYFQNQHQLRKLIAHDKTIYPLIFLVYSKFNSQNCSCDELNQELVKILKLLPMSAALRSEIIGLNPDIFNVQLSNHLYYWYITTILRGIYSSALKIQNLQTWKTQLSKSKYQLSIKATFLAFLQQFFNNNKLQISKTSIHISILENLGFLARQTLKNIPNLLSTNISDLCAMQIIETDPLVDQNTQIAYISELVEKLGAFCVRIGQQKVNMWVAQCSAATVCNIVLHKSKKQEIKQLTVIPELLFHQNDQIRLLFCNFYLLLSSVVKQIKEGFYQINLNKRYVTNHKKCKEYFEALTKMLAFEDNDRYCNQISATFQREISESLENGSTGEFQQTDQALLGKLKVLNEIKLYNPNLKIEPFTIDNITHMLEINSSQQIRNVLYAMSTSMCDIRSNLAVALKIMDNLHLSRNSHIRGRNKMGILNLGCICYINAVVQQLQMIDPFRSGIISTQLHPTHTDFFSSFQWIIYHLSFGQRIYLVPEQFCLNYLDNYGKPINIREQHDADEFLNQLLDRLEVRLKSTNNHGLIGNNFRGEVVNVINCEKCFHKKERVENFYILSVEIKNQRNLQQCLDKYAQTEFICDYFCDFCQSKVETIQKYHRFQSLPPFLFIHLQRLVFDLQTMYKIKLDHPIDFPLQMDFSTYFNSECAEAANYVLKGFVVHVGSSQGGHYYSLIRCESEWIKFDDTRIDPWKWEDGSHDKNNAYLLLYQRKQEGRVQKARVEAIGNKQLMEQVKRDNYSLLKQQIFLQPSFSKFITEAMKKLSPPEFLKIENADLWQQPYHSELHLLPQDFAQQLDIVFEVAFSFVKLEIQSRELNLAQGDYNEMRENQELSSKGFSYLQKISYDILYILHFRPHFSTTVLAEEFLSNAGGNLFSVIYMHRQQKIRQIVRIFLYKVILIIKSQITTSFIPPLPNNSLLQKLLQKFLNALNQVGKHANKMNDFFELIHIIIKLDSRFAEWFQINKFGPRLVHMMMQNESGLEGAFPNYPFYNNNSRKNTTVSLIIDIIGQLASFQKDISIESEENNIERKAYLNFQLYRRLYKDRYQNLCLPAVIAFCSKNNPTFTNTVLNFTIENLNRFSHSDTYIYSYLRLLYSQVIIEDSLQRQRLQRLFGVPLLCKRKDIQNEQYAISYKLDRFCKYQNPLKKMGDEILLSFLQLLYTNRMERNYLVYLGITALLNLMTQNSVVLRYIQDLPGPCPAYPCYTDWIVEFLYSAPKAKQENKAISAEQKKSMLEAIALLINKYQNARSDLSEHIMQQAKEKSLKNQVFLIGKTAFATQWTGIPIKLHQNLRVLNQTQEQYEMNESQLIKASYRIVFAFNSENQQQAQVIQYKLQLFTKATLYLPLQYALYFERGEFQLALPYAEDQCLALKFQVNQNQIINFHEKKQRQEKQSEEKKMEIQEKVAINVDNMNDFPTISQTYQGRSDIGQAVRESTMKQQNGPTYQCPFCCYETRQFSNKCKNCGQEWGDMM